MALVIGRCVGALRTQLRRPKPWEHRERWNDEWRKRFGTLDMSDSVLRERIAPFVSAEELGGLMAQENRATQLVRIQGERLTHLLATERIDDFRHMQMVAVLEELYTLQGKCERIKNFPLPRQYASANHWFVWIFLTLLPLALLGSVHGTDLPDLYTWVVVPLSIVVGRVHREPV